MTTVAVAMDLSSAGPPFLQGVDIRLARPLLAVQAVDEDAYVERAGDAAQHACATPIATLRPVGAVRPAIAPPPTSSKITREAPLPTCSGPIGGSRPTAAKMAMPLLQDEVVQAEKKDAGEGTSSPMAQFSAGVLHSLLRLLGGTSLSA